MVIKDKREAKERERLTQLNFHKLTLSCLASNLSKIKIKSKRKKCRHLKNKSSLS